MRDLRGKAAFVTGGASGIGLAMARAFLNEGMRVMIADIESQALADARTLLAPLGEIHAVTCDVADRAAVFAAADQAFAALGQVHVVCNNAGVGANGPMETISAADWDWVLGVNLMGVVHGIAAFLPHLRAHGQGGHVVNTASMAGLRAAPGMGPYCASKFAVVGLSEGLAMELVDTGIGVSVLCPSWVRTRIQESARARPSRYGPPTAPTRSATALSELVARALSSGMDPDEVARQVLEAIREDRFYIFTHRDRRAAVEERFAAIRAAFDES